MSDADTPVETDPHAAESEWGLEDLKASDEPVERFIRVGGTERRLLVVEASNADAEEIKTKLERGRGGAMRALAEFFSDHIVEPEGFASLTKRDVDEMKVGVAEKLIEAIAPESEGNPIR